MFLSRRLARCSRARWFSTSKDRFRGVTKRLDGRWDAEIKLEDGDTYHIGTFALDDVALSRTIFIFFESYFAGTFDMDFQAARAYDEWAELLGLKSKNLETSTDWISGEDEAEEKETSVFPDRPGELFEVDEIVQGLQKLNGIDISVLDVKETFGLSDYFVIVTGKSVPHMRKMMDSVARALRARKLPNLKRKQIVEGRDCDDWMCVDCENIIVHAFVAEARAAYDLEEHWENAKSDGTNPLYDGKSLDDLQEQFPPYITEDEARK